MNNKRVFIEKKEDFNVEAKLLKEDFIEYLKIHSLNKLRLINVYDLIGGTEVQRQEVIDKLLFEKQVDNLFYDIDIKEGDHFFRVKEVTGQFNQREDSANEIIDFAMGIEGLKISHSKLFIFTGINRDEFEKIKAYYINPVELMELDLGDLVEKNYIENPRKDVEIISGFIGLDREDLPGVKEKVRLGMDLEDLEYCQKYFKSEKRDPSITELMLIDTYWSDHCRHTTFMTELTSIEIEEGRYEKLFQDAIGEYLDSRKFVYGQEERAISLMDLATINQKEIGKKGLLNDKEKTDEVNACSIEIGVDVDGEEERWLLMFKNETHNHPTEIEPFGGAATCLGGAIRDPLSGRSYVYQAMRITGSGDPRKSFEETLDGKLPQRKITRTARDGYSSYGYEIGAGTGYVREIYDEGYMAKRMEVGALLAAAPKENVQRGQAEPGDVVVLVGGRTGRDGLGGAVGSSKEHTEESLESSGAEVQKGNAKIERKILRLFRRKEVSQMIKVCNDFGAGGVSVAIGELADGLKIDLDKVGVKYPGLNGTDIALSESQERMAVVIGRENLEEFLKYSEEEDLEASLVAKVTSDNILRMTWQGDEIVKIHREFLDTNGIRKKNSVKILQPKGEPKGLVAKEEFMENLKDLNITSQKGLIEAFDFSVGKGTVLAPLGGTNKLTPSEGMVAKIPVLNGITNTCSIMTYGFDPKISNWSTYHGGYYSVVESVARVIALGGSYENIRLSFQEYFERLEDRPEKWGKPFTSLLGAYKVQKELDIPAIGGKDSMSGSFEDLDVPPSLISFAVTTDRVENIISPEFKRPNNLVGALEFDLDENKLLDLDLVKKAYKKVKELVDRKLIKSMSTIKYGGIARSIAEMSMGNSIGFKFKDEKNIYRAGYGGLVIEFSQEDDPISLMEGLPFRIIGETTNGQEVVTEKKSYLIADLIKAYTGSLEEVFPIVKPVNGDLVEKIHDAKFRTRTLEIVDTPRVLIPVVAGTHGEYDLGLSFKKAGADVKTLVIKTLTREDFKNSLDELAREIEKSHILAFPDGKIMGGEPEGDGKLYRLIFNDPRVKKAMLEHIYDKNRLVIGIGAGLNALIKVGLIECGRIKDTDDLREGSLFITNNENSHFLSGLVELEVKSDLSPWLSLMEVGESFMAPLATSEGRIVGHRLDRMVEKGQVALSFKDNLTGSSYGIDGLTSPCGKVFGTISSIERIDSDLYKNIYGKNMHRIFEAGVNYFK